MDWSQLQFAQALPQFEPMGRSDAMMASGMDGAGLGMTISGRFDTDASIFAIPELVHALPHIANPPTTSPRIDNAMLDLELDPSAEIFYMSSRQESNADGNEPEIPAVVAARDGWDCFRSAPTIPSSLWPQNSTVARRAAGTEPEEPRGLGLMAPGLREHRRVPRPPSGAAHPGNIPGQAAGPYASLPAQGGRRPPGGRHQHPAQVAHRLHPAAQTSFCCRRPGC